MSFQKRQISLQFTTADDKVINLEGLRASLVTVNTGGTYPVASIQMRVYGMTLDQMNQLSSGGSKLVAIQKINVTVLAGDENGVLGQLFSGGVFSSYIDLSGMPEAAFICAAQAGMYERANPVAPNSWKGTQNAEDVISALAKTIGFTVNVAPGTHAVIQNQYTYGSAMSQIQKIAQAACLAYTIENNTISLYPNDGTRDSREIDVSPKNGLVGYPTYYESGFIIKTQYNPDLLVGRTVNLTSQIPKANGKWIIFESTHQLSTLTPDGPWFTTVKLGAQGTNSVPVN